MTAPHPARRFAWLHPRAFLALFGAVGLLVSAACAWIFFAIADEVPEKGAMVRVDHAVTAWLQAHGTERGESVFVGVSYLGAQGLILLLILAAALLVYRRRWRRLAVLAITCGGGALLNGALKLVYHRARPAAAVEFNPSSWSFPSGHAMDSLIVYGLFAYWISRRWPRSRVPVWVAAVALIGMIGFARIYLGVHYLSDVLAGFSAGTVWLLVCINGSRFAERRRIGSGNPQPNG